MRAEVVVHGEVDEVDLWPYVIASERHGGIAVLALTLHDSVEFLGVLRTLMSRGLVVREAYLLT